MSKRVASSSQLPDSAATSKRFRTAIDDSIDEFLCPITFSLPLDPVMAEDGKVYERSAVEEWLKQHQRSPVTNLPMGDKLVPASAIKNMIERMVKSGALPEEKVIEWKQRLAEQEEVNQLRAVAEGGDAEAAYQLGKMYKLGAKGLQQDDRKAVAWYKQAAEAGNAKGMAALGVSYQYGLNVTRSDALALRWSAAAAALGSGSGMLTLATLYERGAAGLPVDVDEAFKLYAEGCEKGKPNSLGMAKLAMMYNDGSGTPVDLGKAEHWMRKAVAHNKPAAHAERARDWLIARGLEQYRARSS